MLINKLLADNGYIFIKNSNPLYIRSLVNLGSKPIFIYIQDNKRIISKGCFIENDALFYTANKEYIKTHNRNWFNPNNYNIFNFDCCSISEIKTVLSNVKRSLNYAIPILPEPFYFFND